MLLYTMLLQVFTNVYFHIHALTYVNVPITLGHMFTQKQMLLC